MITLPILDLLLALAITVPHPHDPKAITFSGVQGKATLSFRTLPYNPETVANGSGARFSWQGSITSEMAFTVGETTIPAGTYRVMFPGTLADGFKEASFVQGRGSDGITAKPATGGCR